MLKSPSGSERLDALQGDFKNMPAGMPRQNSMASPKTLVSTPRARKCAATDNP
jgi:hypothetical protein